jgi:hypothetical protein
MSRPRNLHTGSWARWLSHWKTLSLGCLSVPWRSFLKSKTDSPVLVRSCNGASVCRPALP